MERGEVHHRIVVNFPFSKNPTIPLTMPCPLASAASHYFEHMFQKVGEPYSAIDWCRSTFPGIAPVCRSLSNTSSPLTIT